MLDDLIHTKCSINILNKKPNYEPQRHYKRIYKW